MSTWWKVERYVKGENMNSWPRLLTGMHMLVRIHRALADIPADRAAPISPAANQIDANEALPYARRAASVIRSWARSASELAAADRTEMLAEQLDAAGRSVNGFLPRQLVHGDFWDNNVLFDTDRVALILDLDFMAPATELTTSPDGGLGSPPAAVERAVLPLALARVACMVLAAWSIDLDWSLEVVRNLGSWQKMFA